MDHDLGRAPATSWELAADVKVGTLEREMHRLKVLMVFLFAFLTAALIVSTVRGQINDNRIELERWQLCQQRVATVAEYNSHLPATATQFPAPVCGPDPRTD